MPEIVLQVVGLTKRYGSLLAVNNLSLDVYQGEVFGLLGPNGAGKTTSINMICGLLQPDSGHVLMQGRIVPGANLDVGICPQEIVLWSHLTCLEQLQFVGEMYDVNRREARQRGEQLLETLGLISKRHAQARTLSGGMKRRLNLAMALVHNPEIVILDEPEAGLDPQSRVTVRDYIKQLAVEKTIILTTHNMDEAERLADRVAIIDHGKLLVVDTPDALKNQVGIGDVLEIVLKDAGNNHERVLAALAAFHEQATITVTGDHLQIRTLNAVNLLSDILNCLESTNVSIGEVRLRENTLEDVFIQLTGRRLRE